MSENFKESLAKICSKSEKFTTLFYCTATYVRSITSSRQKAENLRSLKTLVETATYVRRVTEIELSGKPLTYGESPCITQLSYGFL